ncbi:MAG TPA: hypothetical protein DDZ89_01910 [Clostridiales bacterium]|nr:hypothetical protein [Clostridiales bacterium]
MFELDMKTIEREVYEPYQQTEIYKTAVVKLQKAIEKGDEMEIDDSVVFLETRVCELTYIKAFHDGMKFILDTIAGKEVIEI